MVCNFEIGGYTKKSEKFDKESKNYIYVNRLENIGLNNLQERNEVIKQKNFKIIDGISIHGNLFSIFLFELEIFIQGIKKSLHTLSIFFDS